MRLNYLFVAIFISVGSFASAENPRRLPIFHLVEGGKAFVKTSESIPEPQYRFEVCEVDYRKLASPAAVMAFLNSGQAHCERINETVFSESDSRTNLLVNLAVQTELDKQMSLAAEKNAGKSATFKMIFGQVVSVLTFVGVNTAAHAFSRYGYPILAQQAASFGVIISAAAYVGAVLISDRIRNMKYGARPTVFDYSQMNPVEADGLYYLELRLPPELSTQTAELVISESLDRATRKVYLMLGQNLNYLSNF